MGRGHKALEYLDVVDNQNRVVGKYTSVDVHRSLLNHRAIHVLVFHNENILIQKRSPDKRIFPDYWDITVTGHVNSGESYREAGIRECFEELGIHVGGFDVVREFRPAQENGFEFCSLAILSINSQLFQQIAPNHEIAVVDSVTPVSLCRQMCSPGQQEHYTYGLYQAMIYLSENNNALSGYVESLKSVLSAYYLSTKNATYLPRYGVQPSDDADYAVMAAEIIQNRDASSDQMWMEELSVIYDNVRPYYPAPHGLEVGSLAVGHDAIETFLRSAADAICDLSQDIRIIGKQRSGWLLANRLQAELKSRGRLVERCDMRTRWQGHASVELVQGSSQPLTPKLNVICDTMISSGITVKTISQELNSRGAGNDILVAVLVEVERPRPFVPRQILSACKLQSNDWLIGYNSDAPFKKVYEGGRALPFIVQLKPLGMGVRKRLIEQFRLPSS